MPKISNQEMMEATQFYWELEGKRISKEPNPVQKMAQVDNALQKYLR